MQLVLYFSNRTAHVVASWRVQIEQGVHFDSIRIAATVLFLSPPHPLLKSLDANTWFEM